MSRIQAMWLSTFLMPLWAIGAEHGLVPSGLGATHHTVDEARSASDSTILLKRELAAATAEAEVFRRKANELNLRLEALGAGSVDERLLKLLNNLSLGDKKQASLKESLIGLSEAVLRYQKVSTSENATARLELEAAVRSASAALGLQLPATESPGVSSSLIDGRVVSLREDLSLLVANIGATHGVRVGMPFEVLRDDQVIGAARVVDVRDSIAGALVQDLGRGQSIKVGDRLKVTATQ